MPSRYTKTQKLSNNSEYYSFLRKKRHVRNIVQYATPKLYNPSPSARASLVVDTHIWKYGDRFYNLASQYYGDVRYWWVIAWYNAYPTEAHLKPGMVIQIPVNLQATLEILGV